MKKFYSFLIAAIIMFAIPMNGQAETKTITLDYSSFGLTNSYAVKTATVNGIGFTIDQGYKGSGNVIQMNSSKGNGILYNTTPISGLQSITVNVSSGNKTYTITTGTSEKPTTNSQTGSATGTYNAASGNTYFQLKVSGASYFSSIEITYEEGGNSVATPSFTPDGGEFVSSQEVTINCTTTGATIYYTTDGNTPTTSSTQYNGPFTITTTTTVKAFATKSGMTDSQAAEATFTKVTPLANIAALTSKTENGTYYVTFDNAMVTYVNGNNAYIQDASGAVAMYKSEHGLTAGDVLNGTATVTYQLRNGNPQITNLEGVTSTSGTAPNPTEVAASGWSYIFNNVISQYFKVTGATLTKNNSKYYVSLGGEDIQLYKSGTNISSLDLTKTYTIIGFPTLYTSSNGTTKELQIYADPEIEVSSEPTIIVSPLTLNAFTYVVENGPSAAQSITVSGNNLTTGITLASSQGDDSAFEWSLNEDNGYSNSLSISQNNGEVTTTTVFVRMKAGLAVNDYNDVLSASSTGASAVNVSLNGTVSAPEASNFTWNLSIDETATATTSELTWTSSYATMGVVKGSATTNTNNYYPGTTGQNYTSTRFYKNSVLTIAPISGYFITSVVFTATTNSFAKALKNSSWTNATASMEDETAGTIVTVTPTDGTADMEATIGANCGFTAVKVYYGYTLVINAYNSDATGWNLIASPVNITPNNANMLINTHDLYRFNQSATNQWENYYQHKDDFNLVPGSGYLYANSGQVTLTFSGIPYNGDGIFNLSYDDNVSETGIKGLNLVGNPFSTNATVDKDFYEMNTEGSAVLATVSTSHTIAPMQGIFVKATATGETVTFTPQTSKSNGRSAVVMNLSENSSVIDRAIVCINESRQLPKFQLFENSTKLYITQDNEDFAIVGAEAQGEMPVNFKAEKNGSYTISINAEDVEMNYLHLIDNMTGANVDLLATPSYSFEAKTDDYASRFRLVFSAQGNANEETTESFAFISGNSFVLNNEGNATLQVIDMLGRVVSTEQVEGNIAHNVPANAGVYVLRLTNGNDVKTQKIVVR